MAKQQPAWRVSLNYYIGGLILAKILVFLIFSLFLKNALAVLNGAMPFWVELISGLFFVILAAYFGAWYINSRYIFIKKDVLRWSLYYYIGINVVLMYIYFGFVLIMGSKVQSILSLEFIGSLLISLLLSLVYFLGGKIFIKTAMNENSQQKQINEPGN
ncbi:MAG TPA: hypothetical protein PLA19_01995 [Candidatus Pacearchaeota archaeon]|nr:hypothetical protein [Candidatus Pacearchaeota archaeon]